MSSWQRSRKQASQSMHGELQQQSFIYSSQQQHQPIQSSSTYELYPSQSQFTQGMPFTEQFSSYNSKVSPAGVSGQYYPPTQMRSIPLSPAQVVGGTSGIPLALNHSRSPSSTHSNAGQSSSASYTSSSKFDSGDGNFVSPSPSLRQVGRGNMIAKSDSKQELDQHVNLGPAPLRRGQACQSCRRRKLKCDAIKPVCSTCKRSRKAAANANHVSPVPDGDCLYDDFPPSGSLPAVAAVHSHPSVQSSAPETKVRRQSNVLMTYTNQFDNDASSLSAATKKRRTTVGGERQVTVPWDEQKETAVKGEISKARNNNILAFNPGESEQSRSRRLEERIRQLENELEEAQNLAIAKEEDSSSMEMRARPAYSASGPAVPILSMLSPSSGKEEKYRMQYSQRPARYPEGSNLKNELNLTSDEVHKDSTLFDFSLSATSEKDRDEQVRNELASGHYAKQDPILQLLWPGWSTDLPSPDTVSAICEIFFRLHPMRNLVYKPSFMSGLSLPPKHPHRPHDSLIHAILATTADISPFYEIMTQNGQDRFVMMLSDSRSRPNLHLQHGEDEQLSFKEFHLRKARAKVEMSLITDFRNPLDWIAASLLSCFTLWNDYRITESYFLSAILCRACSPAGLDKLPSQHLTGGIEPNRVPGLFGSPQGVEEHERRIALWHIFIADGYTGGSPSFYENLLGETSILTHLPCSVSDYQAGRDVPPNIQTLDSPDLFSTGHLDDFTLHIKSQILVRRSCTLQCRNQLTKKKPAGISVIDKQISEFIASFPHLEFDYQDHLNVDRLSAWANISLAIFHLHEPYLTPTSISVKDDNPLSNYSVKRIHMAIDNILNLIHRLMNTSFDFALLHPQMFLAWSVCGRMLGKDLDYIKRTGIGGDYAMHQVLDKLQWIITALERGGEKNIKARRCSELVSYVRSGTMHEGILSQLLYTDGVIPTGDEDGMTSIIPNPLSSTSTSTFDIALSMSNGEMFSPGVGNNFQNQSSSSNTMHGNGNEESENQQSMQTNYNGNDMLLNFAF